MPFTIKSSNVWFILHIYGTDDDFLQQFYTYLGEEVAYKYFDNTDIFEDMMFVNDWGKGYNRVITSLVRAFYDVYNESFMNATYLKNEEKVKEKHTEGGFLFYAEQYQDLKLLYKNIDGDRFMCKYHCPYCCEIVFL